MPAIDLARLRKQTAELADLFDQPAEFLREHREILDHYVNRTLRSQSVAPSSVLPTYRAPSVVLRHIENEVGPIAERRPIQALELADALWDEGWLETRLLAAYLLGRIPPQEERLLARLTAWTQAVRDPSVRAALLRPGPPSPTSSRAPPAPPCRRRDSRHRRAEPAHSVACPGLPPRTGQPAGPSSQPRASALAAALQMK